MAVVVAVAVIMVVVVVVAVVVAVAVVVPWSGLMFNSKSRGCCRSRGGDCGHGDDRCDGGGSDGAIVG